jgi:transposase
MDQLHRRCAGLDVHKDTVVACARVAKGRRLSQHVETFATTTQDLLRLADWLRSHGCTHVAMEATGVYWKPVWHVLEDSFELVLANARDVRNVPGRKTDVKDAEWIADLLAHGLIRGSFVPPRFVQEMRDLTRTRKQLVREVAQHTQRIQKTLEDANIKVTGLISDILGVSGRAILEALVAGESDPECLADRGPLLKAPRPKLVEALRGQVTDHHRFLLRLHLDQVDALQRAIERVECHLEDLLKPFRDRVRLLMTTPGISRIAANVIVSEIGFDMTRFPSAGHLRSWAGLCPRHDESAGKRRSTRVRKGAPWLKTTLVQAAWAAVRKKDSYLQAQFHRIKSRRGSKKAILAVAASILTSSYYILRDGVEYRDLGSEHFRRHTKQRTIMRLLQRLDDLGCQVAINTT